MKAILNPSALNVDGELTTAATTSQKYPLGMEIQIYNDTYNSITKYIYITATTTMTATLPYQLTPGGSGQEWTAITPATTGGGLRICVPPVTATTGKYLFAAIKGLATGTLAASTTYVAGNPLVCIKGAATFAIGTTTVLAPLPGTVATVYASATTTATQLVNLIGDVYISS